jgi:hypothetical protein
MTPIEMLAGCRPYIRASLTHAQQRLQMVHTADGPAPAHLNPKNYVSALEAEEKRLQELLDGIDRICGF